jgi:hypothetical protein
MHGAEPGVEQSRLEIYGFPNGSHEPLSSASFCSHWLTPMLIWGLGDSAHECDLKKFSFAF